MLLSERHVRRKDDGTDMVAEGLSQFIISLRPALEIVLACQLSFVEVCTGALLDELQALCRTPDLQGHGWEQCMSSNSERVVILTLLVLLCSVPEVKPGEPGSELPYKGLNVWPEEHLVPGFRETLTAYMEAAHDMSRRSVAGQLCAQMLDSNSLLLIPAMYAWSLAA